MTDLEHVYIVTGETGEYDDYTEWSVYAFRDEQEAEAFAQKCNDWCLAKGVHMTSDTASSLYMGTGYEERKAFGLDSPDPNFSMDYTGSTYSVKSVPFMQEGLDTSFAFDDLDRLSLDDLYKVIRRALSVKMSIEEFSITLKLVSSDLREKIIGMLPTENQEIVKDNLERRVKKSSVEAAQAKVVKLACQMADAGEITLNVPESTPAS